MKQVINIGSILLPIIAVGLFVSQIVFTNNLAQDGTTVKALTQKTDLLVLDNDRMEQQIASLSSLLSIQKQAETAGFVPATHFLTLKEGQYLVSLTQKR